MANYTVQFADNRQYVVGATLPVLLKEGQYGAAQKLLATLPANEMLEERYAVSEATRNKAKLCVWHDCCISKNRQILPAWIN
ncbi:hypothetical protein ACLK1Z_03375 [Escherichia coli]